MNESETSVTDFESADLDDTLSSDDDTNENELDDGDLHWSYLNDTPSSQAHNKMVKSQYNSDLSCLTEGLLDQALNDSIYHVPARPLILCINDDKSISRHIFWYTVVKNDSVVRFLNENFLVWKWNRTAENSHKYVPSSVFFFTEEWTNDQKASRLIDLLKIHVGENVVKILSSVMLDEFPLMIPLTFNAGQIRVECLIRGNMSETEVLNHLVNAHDGFNNPLLSTDTAALPFKRISKEDWFIGQTNLIPILPSSKEYSEVEVDFNNNESTKTIISIHRVENPLWLMAYVNEKERVDTRIQYHESERLLFHGCPYASAEKILQEGFDPNQIGKHGSLYGRGFYFSSKRSLSDGYARPDRACGHQRMLMCRVLIGAPCQGNSSIVSCPDNFDSTTDFSNIHVVYSNRQIFPEYLITYK